VAQGEASSAMAVECKEIADQARCPESFLKENHLQKLSGQWRITNFANYQ
jgi:hypothetical protein